MREVWLGTWAVREIIAHIAGWHREMLPAPGAAADAPAHRGAPVSVRRGRRWRAAGLDQRAGSGTLPDAVEPLRALRARPARSARVPPAAAVRVLGPRGLPGADLDAAVVATCDARLSGA